MFVASTALVLASACGGSDDATGSSSGGSTDVGGSVPTGGSGGAATGSTGGTNDTGGTANTGGTTNTGGGGGGPLYGLEQRPSNTTCLGFDDPPDLLSQSGCVDPTDATQAASGLIPYDVNHPFWSDGALKERWMALPDGEVITIEPDGDWTFPVGTVLMKRFTLGTTLVETRLLVHQNNGWKGFGYEWNAGGTDATKSSGQVQIPNIDWEIPSTNDCRKCHTGGAGDSLGPTIPQLNRSLLYPSTGITANQLATLEHIGMFAAALGDVPSNLPVMPELQGAAPLQDRARAYLEVNCSMCHQPSEEGLWDGRMSTPFGQQGLCNAVPTKGDLGSQTNRLILPGDASGSIVVLRMQSLSGPRMPPLGTHVVDTTGVDVLSQWINGLSGCP
jgi:uncharacterized repeat protein (TIGR03806 family)